MFIKPRFDPNGEFDKIKARLVGGGHRQKRYLFYSETETSSPTISLVIVALTATKEGRTVITADVAGRCIPASIYEEACIYQDQSSRVSNISRNVP